MQKKRDNRKHEIIRVGHFGEDGHPLGWMFDGEKSNQPGLRVTGDGFRWGGWSLQQLRAIANAEKGE